MEHNPPLDGVPRRPFRFGVVSASARSTAEWLARAQRVESLGYASLLMPDNLQHTLAPLPALAMAAAVTRTLRLGTYVLPNDFRHPVLLAKDVGTLDLLSGGRFELGIGAGRPDAAAENRMLGLPFDSGSTRIQRLAESVSIVKALLGGERVSRRGSQYNVEAAQVSPIPLQQPHPPILMAGSGRKLLSLAAREANIVALGVPPDATAAEAAERVGWVRDAAGARFADLELNINLMAVGDHLPRWIAARLQLSARDLAERGSVAAVHGTPDDMCQQLVERRERLGISYVVVSDEFMDAFAPVVERLAGR